jgi:hypothetical protein
MVFVMSLAATMVNDRVQQTKWAFADDRFCFCPIGFQVALRCRK